MFDLPDAKRIRRSDLQTSPQSSRASTPDPEALALFRSKLSFEEVSPATTTAALPTNADVEEEEEEELEFRLFAPSKPTTTSTTDGATTTPSAPTRQTIRIKSPETEDSAEPGFINPERNRNYYFTGELSAAKKEEFDIAALTGEDVRRLSRKPCPGCAYPWKLITLPASSFKKTITATDSTAANIATEAFVPEGTKKRTRAGKKDRIKKRQKAEGLRKKKEEEVKMREEKEVSERAKKARRNREKKFKKRARDKAKRVAEGGEVGDGDVGIDGDGAQVSGDEMSE